MSPENTKSREFLISNVIPNEYGKVDVTVKTDKGPWTLRLTKGELTQRDIGQKRTLRYWKYNDYWYCAVANLQPGQRPQPVQRDAKDSASIERQNALRHADAALAAALIGTEEAYQRWAERCLTWIQTGQWPAGSAISVPNDDPPMSEPPEGDDTPF